MSKTAKRLGSFVNCVVIVCMILTSFSPKPVIAAKNISTENNTISSLATTNDLPSTLYYDPPVFAPISSKNPHDQPNQNGLPPQPEQEDLSFKISTDKDVITSSTSFLFNVTIQNNSTTKTKKLQFLDELETGIEYVSKTGDVVSYDSKKRTISYNIGIIEPGTSVLFSYQLKITSIVSNNLFVHSTKLKGNGPKDLIAETFFSTTTTGLTTTSQIDLAKPEGGWASMGNVSVYTSEGELPQNTILSATSVNKYKNGPQKQYELDVFKTGAVTLDTNGDFNEQKTTISTKQKIEFEKPAFIEFNFNGVIDLNNIPAGKEPYVAVYDETSKVWVKVPILEQDFEDNTVVVEAKHFSTWGVGLGSSMPQNGANVLLFDQPYSSLFTGASRYQIPISIPSGRTGMAPQIALSYSSGTANGILGDVQASWVGMGWNIDDTEIVRKIYTDANGYGYVNSFALTLNGQLYELNRDSANLNRYFVKRDGFLYVERHNESLQNEGSPNNSTGEWWEVVTTDGTRYRLGYNQDSEQLALMYGYSCTDNGLLCVTPNGAYASLGYAGKANNLIAKRWRVDRVTDVHGNYIEYAYQEYQPAANSQVPVFDRESYLKTISYTGFTDPNGLTSNDLLPGYQIRFNLADRSSIGDVPSLFYIWDTFDSMFLDSIDVCLNMCDAADHTLIRNYDLDYSLASAPNANGTLVLNNIVISGGGFTENNISIPSTSTPKISFEYQNLANRAFSAGVDQFSYPLWWIFNLHLWERWPRDQLVVQLPGERSHRQ
ncbi:MAG: SpvB/TcaC N-terminal domain-containing protein [Anaerolineaceae bacterium]